MGDTFVEALISAMRGVVPPDVTIEAGTPLDHTTLDSLGLLEVFVHLEALTGRRFDEETVRALALDTDHDPSMPVRALADLLDRAVGGHGTPVAPCPAGVAATGGAS